MKSILLLVGTALLHHVQAGSLELTQSIPLPGAQGRIDHLSLDAAGGRLFVAALGNGTVEVVDLKSGKLARSLQGFAEPQGLLFLPGFNRLYVANGGDGTVRVMDGTGFDSVATIKLGDDADNLRYDSRAKQVIVGYGSGALGIIDATKNLVVGTIPLTAHPESFQLENDRPRAFVNLPSAHSIAVIDRSSRQVIGQWALGMVSGNYPMALDEANHRAFVACRTPGRLLVFDAQAGRELESLTLHGDCDDVFHDPRREQIYASCGEGFIDVFVRTDTGHYVLKEAIATVAKARTCLFDGENIYLAVPRRSDSSAEIRVYHVTR